MSRQITPNFLKDHIKVKKLNPTAELPVKVRQSDIGYDLTLISRSDNRAEDNVHEVNMFSTGLAVTPPPGYYFELMVRSSLHRNGYMLATGTSIIDPEYTGELLVPLYKFKQSPDLDLPFRAVQLVLKKAEYAHIASVPSLGETSRGNGGFGSTNVYQPQFTIPQNHHGYQTQTQTQYQVPTNNSSSNFMY